MADDASVPDSTSCSSTCSSSSSTSSKEDEEDEYADVDVGDPKESDGGDRGGLVDGALGVGVAEVVKERRTPCARARARARTHTRTYT